jgi:hypothetical protein
MSWIDRASAWFWNRVAISSHTPSTGLGVLRIAAGLFFLVWFMPVRRWVGVAPPAFFNPPPISLARFFSGFPPEAVMAAADVVAVALACLIVVGVKARSCTIALTVLSIAGNVFVYAFGKIDHDILLYVFLGCMAFSGWGRQLAWLPDRRHRSDVPERSLALLAVCIAFAMFSAGFEKAIFWVDLDLQTGGFLSWFYTGYFDLDRRHLLAPVVLTLPPSLFELADYAAVVFELGALPALLIGPLAWRLWLLGACLFHLTSTLLLNISFDAHFLPLIAFVDFSRLQATLQKLGRGQLARWPGVAAVMAIGVVHLLANGQEQLLLLGTDPGNRTGAALYLATVLWVVATAFMARTLLDCRRGAYRQPRELRPAPGPPPTIRSEPSGASQRSAGPSRS